MAQHKRDYYEVLGVQRSATLEEIKKAYRKCALEHHPDKNPGDKQSEGLFKEATEAYQVLADPEKRRLYDQFGHAGVSGAAGGFSSAGFGDIFQDIFEDFFSGAGGSVFGGGGAGRSRSRPQRGGDLEHEVEISFRDAAFGVEKDLPIRREETCAACRGDGAKPGTSRKTCPACNGTGQILASSGFFSISRTCHRCRGEGSMIEHACPACSGRGRVMADRKIQLKIPAGVDNGLRLRVTGEGEAGLRGGPRGDLYIDIHVRPHELFVRTQDNILCEVPVSFVQATLGCEMEVPTLVGTTTLKIPAGTQTGRIFKLKGKGLPSLRGGGLGDEEIRVIVETPTHLTEKQKELLKEFASVSGEKVNPISRTFVEKMKKVFSK